MYKGSTSTSMNLMPKGDDSKVIHILLFLSTILSIIKLWAGLDQIWAENLNPLCVEDLDVAQKINNSTSQPFMP